MCPLLCLEKGLCGDRLSFRRALIVVACLSGRRRRWEGEETGQDGVMDLILEARHTS